jgi:hypothetical protein
MDEDFSRLHAIDGVVRSRIGVSHVLNPDAFVVEHRVRA